MNRTAAVSVLAAALLLASCSSSDDGGGTASSSRAPGSSSAAPSASTTSSGPASSSGSSAGPNSLLRIDGTQVPAEFTTTCSKQDGVLNLLLDAADQQTYGHLTVSAILTAADDGVRSVAITGEKGGQDGGVFGIGFTADPPNGTASGQNDGIQYRVTGEGNRPDLTTPVPFDVIFACDTVTGG